MKVSTGLNPNRFSTAERLVLAALALLGASCAGSSDVQRFEADFGPWALELTWQHHWEPLQSGPATKTCQARFESLELILDPGRMGEDLAIDNEKVSATFLHGGMTTCSRPHHVTGTVRLLERRATNVRARVDALMHCPDAPPVALKGDFTFETKVPP